MTVLVLGSTVEVLAAPGAGVLEVVDLGVAVEVVVDEVPVGSGAGAVVGSVIDVVGPVVSVVSVLSGETVVVVVVEVMPVEVGRLVGDGVRTAR